VSGISHYKQLQNDNKKKYAHLGFGGVFAIGFPMGLGVVVVGVAVLRPFVEVGPVAGAERGLAVSLAGPLPLPLRPGHPGREDIGQYGTYFIVEEMSGTETWVTWSENQNGRICTK